MKNKLNVSSQSLHTKGDMELLFSQADEGEPGGIFTTLNGSKLAELSAVTLERENHVSSTENTVGWRGYI